MMRAVIHPAWPLMLSHASKLKSRKDRSLSWETISWGNRKPNMQPGPIRKSAASSGAWVEDVKRNLFTLIQPSGHHPLLVFQVCSNEIATRIPRAIKCDLRVLGQLGRRSGAEVLFCPSGSREWWGKKQAEPAPLNHVPTHHSYISFKYFQQLNHCPGQSVPVFDSPMALIWCAQL